MILYGAVILVIIINNIEAAGSSNGILVQTSTENGVRPDEIAKLIYKINKNNARPGKKDRYLKQLHNTHAIDVDYFGERIERDDEKSIILEQVLKSLGASALQGLDENHEIRINFIKNPQVLEEYKQNLRKKKRESTSSESDDSSDVSDFYRRNAVFRINSKQSTSESTLKNKRDRYKNSQESDRPRDGNREKDELRYKKKTNHGDHEMSVEFRDRPNSKKSDDGNAWDKIVKHFNGRDSSDKNKDNNQDSFDKKSKKEDKYNNQYKNNNENQDGYDKNWQDNNNKNDNDKNDWDRKDNGRDKKDESWNKKETNWDAKESNLDKKANNKHKLSRDTDKKDNDWDKKINSDGKKENSWNDWTPKTEEKSDKQKKNRKWDKPGADVHNYDKNIKKDVYQEKPMNSAKGRNNKPFVPKISDYYKSRPQLADHADRSGFKAFGRTSIPFVGKKGIYEE